MNWSLADLYEAVADNQRGDMDLPLWLALATNATRILELGAGTARVLRALLAEGHDAWGIDIDEERIALGRRRLSEAGLDPQRLLSADARSWSAPCPFDLVIAPYNLMGLLDDDAAFEVLTQTLANASSASLLSLEAQVWPITPDPGRAWHHGRTDVEVGGEPASYRETVVEKPGGVLQIGRRFRLPDGSERQTMLSIRVRPVDALVELLARTGWMLAAPIVDEEGRPPNDDSKVVYLTACRS